MKNRFSDIFIIQGEIIMNKRDLRFSLFAFILIFFNSCDGLFEENLIIKIDKKTFEEERTAWNLQNIKDYEFSYEFFNDTGPTGFTKITIKKNEETIIENQYNQDVPFKSIADIYDFLSGTFDFIESVKNGTYDGFEIKSLTLNITYNSQYHYPQEVDFSEGYVETIDGGGYYNLKIKGFKSLNLN